MTKRLKRYGGGRGCMRMIYDLQPGKTVIRIFDVFQALDGDAQHIRMYEKIIIEGEYKDEHWISNSEMEEWMKQFNEDFKDIKLVLSPMNDGDCFDKDLPEITVKHE